MCCIQYALLLSFVVYVASSNLVQTDVYFHELVLKTHLWVRLKSCHNCQRTQLNGAPSRLRQPQAEKGNRHLRQMVFHAIKRLRLSYRDVEEVPLAAPSGTLNCNSILSQSVLRQRRPGHLTNRVCACKKLALALKDV